MAFQSDKLNDKSRPVRIGAAIGPHDAYWVQLRETVFQRIEQLGASLVPLEISDSNETLYSLDPTSLAEELLSQDLDAMVCQTLPLGTIYQLVYNGLPVVFLGESQLQHRLFCSPQGLYQAGQVAAEYIAEKLKGKGRVLCVGGLLDHGEDKGVSRISACVDTLRKYPDISVLHCPTAWRYEQAYPLVLSALRELGTPIDALFGISDSLALAARDAGRASGMITPNTLIVGINGDPAAFAAIAEGSYHATVETAAEDLGISAVDLAIQAAHGKPLPRHYPYTIRLITAENYQEHVLRKLINIASLPNRLVGVNREEERHRLVQLETGATINRHVGSLLDRRQLSQEVSKLIRVNYGFDHVQLFIFSAEEKMLYLDGQEPTLERVAIPLHESGLLGESIRRNQTIFIPDTHFSHRFLPDPDWPDTRSRVIMPIHLGDEILALLDLHSRKPVQNLRWELIGLQALADQFAIALRNAELYSEAVAARESSDRANQLKTRLLANVSHELRTPLNVILGYSQAALSTPNLYGIPLPENLRQDLTYIYQSGEHLIRIINDLLDLSRAEIGELNVFPEPINTLPLLQEIFRSMAKTRGKDYPEVTWDLDLPKRLPIIYADPVRLRQVLLNLLSNSCKFTTRGTICLGAEVEPPYLHLWVSDTGPGIPIEQQERIFEPFVSNDYSQRRREGIGLGLSITRHLVALHGGSMSLESQPEKGSAFHVYLPLPNLAGEICLPAELGTRPALLLLMMDTPVQSLEIPEEVRRIAARQQLEICPVHSREAVEELLREVQPVALAWDMGHAAASDWNLVQRLRSHPQLSNLPLVLFGQEAQESLSMGITNLLLKPLNGKKLTDLIESLRPCGSTGTVLVADDDPQARALYEDFVTQAMPGFAIHAVADGEQAVRFLQENVPALVILDLIMPNMDGFQVLERIRSNSRTCKIPVIVLSGKMLTFEDVARLNYANVVFHSKGILSTAEIVELLQQTISGDARLGQPTSQLVKQTLAYLHQNYHHVLTRSELAEAVGVSESYLTQIFHQELGLSIKDCINRLRIQKARELLLSSDETVTAIGCQVGFDDPAYFSRVFRKISGCSPQAFRKN